MSQSIVMNSEDKTNLLKKIFEELLNTKNKLSEIEKEIEILRNFNKKIISSDSIDKTYFKTVSSLEGTVIILKIHINDLKESVERIEYTVHECY